MSSAKDGWHVGRFVAIVAVYAGINPGKILEEFSHHFLCPRPPWRWSPRTGQSGGVNSSKSAALCCPAVRSVPSVSTIMCRKSAAVFLQSLESGLHGGIQVRFGHRAVVIASICTCSRCLVSSSGQSCSGQIQRLSS